VGGLPPKSQGLTDKEIGSQRYKKCMLQLGRGSRLGLNSFPGEHSFEGVIKLHADFRAGSEES